MKAKDLMKILNSVNPDSEVGLSLGADGEYEYRKACAKAELVSSECLCYLAIDKVVINDTKEDYGLWADIVLKQDNITDMESYVKDFDKLYPKYEPKTKRNK